MLLVSHKVVKREHTIGFVKSISGCYDNHDDDDEGVDVRGTCCTRCESSFRPHQIRSFQSICMHLLMMMKHDDDDDDDDD